MLRDEAKIIVNYYAGIPEMLKSLRQQKEEIEDGYYGGVKGVNIDGMPHGYSPGRPTETMAIHAAEKGASDRLREIETKMAVLRMDREVIQAAIDGLNDRYKKLILYRYIDDYSWTKTAIKMHASDSTVRYWADKALDRLIYAFSEAPMIDEILGRASRARK